MHIPKNTRSGFSLIEMVAGITLTAILATSATMAASESYVAFKSARV